MTRIDKLQKQVDKLKSFIDFKTANIMCEKCKEQTIKDTAKEIYTQVLEWIPICEGYGEFIDNLESWLKERYGVEVE